MCSSSIDDLFFLSTDFTDFTEVWEGGVNHGFTRIFADFYNLRFNFLTSDFTDFTDFCYAFGWSRWVGWAWCFCKLVYWFYYFYSHSEGIDDAIEGTNTGHDYTILYLGNI